MEKILFMLFGQHKTIIHIIRIRQICFPRYSDNEKKNYPQFLVTKKGIRTLNTLSTLSELFKNGFHLIRKVLKCYPPYPHNVLLLSCLSG